MNSEKRTRAQDEPPGENGAKHAVPSHEAYTVGWVCALPKEQTAAIAMLDQRHPNLPNMQPPSDPNAYTLGSIGEHNIVIACLPKGQIGVVSAATVVTNMVSTFSSIKIGLMVGIGGGIPSNKVRLGDVVVSTPTGTHPGVVQWDFGKATDGGKFERIGSLNNPPTFLLAALAKLETSHEMEGSSIDEYLQDLGRKFPKLAAKYLRSESLRDVLFRADISHIDGDDTSSDEEDHYDPCKQCDKTHAKERRPRGTRIHYGLIASGNQVIKDAVFRDQLNQDLGGNVLCVEMEAAGLMSNFPCLVIRGVCDYADSHKNKEWQEHAAASAAALAKEFLTYIESQTIEREPSVKDILIDIHSLAAASKLSLQNVRDLLDRKEDLEILEWLTPLDYGSEQSDMLSRHHPGTCTWFLESEPFQSWLASRGETLFCPGIPGSGKTIIASVVIDHIGRKLVPNHASIIAFMYCSYKSHGEQTLHHLLSSLLKQASCAQRALPDVVRQLHEENIDQKRKPSVDELMAAIEIVLASRRAYIVVDALDECSSDNHCQSSLVACLRKLQQKTNVNVMYTSRFALQSDNEFENCLRQVIRARDQDVYNYIDAQLPKALRFISETPDLLSAVKSKIMGLVDGMFLLAQLYLNVISDQTSAFEVRQVLRTIETSANSREINGDKTKLLNKAYEQAMERIQQQPPRFHSLGMKTLSWIVHAERPLTTFELQHALAVKTGDTQLDVENVRKTQVILSVCAGLVTIDEKSNIIRLAHFTTQEYLMSLQSKFFQDAQSDMAVSCITYLNFHTPKTKTRSDQASGPPSGFPPFTYYAADNWGHHARKASKLPSSVFEFITDQKNVSFSCGLVSGVWTRAGGRDLVNPHRGWTGLQAAAYFGLVEAARVFIEDGCYLDNEGSRYIASPLFIATAFGFEEVARLLLNNKADVNAQCGRDWTALMLAVSREDMEMVRLLLDRGANTDLCALGGLTALSVACEHGHTAIARLLLQVGACTDLGVSRRGNLRLSEVARQHGHSTTAELLIEWEEVGCNNHRNQDPDRFMYWEF